MTTAQRNSTKLTQPIHGEFALFATTYFLTEIPLMLGATVVYRRSREVH